MPVLKAIYDKKLAEYLEKIGLLKKIQNEMLVCHKCRNKVTMTNFGAVKKVNGELIVFCNSPECVARSLE